jgi:hypothetical protein
LCHSDSGAVQGQLAAVSSGQAAVAGGKRARQDSLSMARELRDHLGAEGINEDVLVLT